jgi:hypothetical protein
MSSITIVSDAPNCGITYDRHYGDRNSFIIHATGLKPLTVGLLGEFSTTVLTSGLYYKTIMIVIMTIISDATIWIVTYDRD